ncbi:MAG: hypothetical protein HY401_03320 [Elusimicrobia bacterium]|nr:hypothetical protein [Elusimicrobiota bacterium]
MPSPAAAGGLSRKEYTGTSAAQFLKLGIGNAEAMALGRSYVAIADGVESLGFNPAGIARSNSREFALGMTSWIGDFRGNYVGYNHPMLHANLALNAAYFTMGDFDARDEKGLPIAGSNVFVRTGFTHAGFGWSLPTERIFLGAAAKAVYEDYSGKATTNFAGDAGVLWLPDKPWQLGASLLNLSMDTGDIPWSLRVGGAWRFPSMVTLISDLIQDSDSETRVGVGMNIELPEVEEIGFLNLRFGYYTADDQGESTLGILKSFNLHRTSGLSYGLGIDSTSESLHNMSLDYAMLPLGALGTTHHVSVKFRF